MYPLLRWLNGFVLIGQGLITVLTGGLVRPNWALPFSKHVVRAKMGVLRAKRKEV